MEVQKAPLNRFIVKRATLTGATASVYTVPFYEVEDPDNTLGPNLVYEVDAILTQMTFTNTTGAGVTVSVSVTDNATPPVTYTVFNNISVPANSYKTVDVKGLVLQNRDILKITGPVGTTVHVSLTESLQERIVEIL